MCFIDEGLETMGDALSVLSRTIPAALRPDRASDRCRRSRFHPLMRANKVMQFEQEEKSS